MPSKFSKKQRLFFLTFFMGFLFVIITFIVLWSHFRSRNPYLPGEEIEGLTTDLFRSLPKDYPQIIFTDITKQAGIDFKHFSGTRSSQLPEDMGSGAAWGDYDNDGWQDLFIVNTVGSLKLSPIEIENSSAHCALYHNNKDGTFSEVSTQAGVDYRGWGMGAAWGDYNNDELPDLFITSYGKNVFFHNNGDGTFTDRTEKSGLGGLEGFWTGVSWADYNRDGYLDIFVCGYVKYSNIEPLRKSKQYDVEVPASINPSTFKPEQCLLYKNNGDGTFKENSEWAGVDNANGRSLSAAWCDFNEDGWPDLYIANDVSDNALFYNLENGKFEDISHKARVADYRGAMGIAIGDWDKDQDLDMFITHWIAQENALYNNLKSQIRALNDPTINPLMFMDEADRYGVGQIALDFIGFGTFFFDYDNNGNLDLFVVNGSTFQQKSNPELLVPMANQIFWNRNAEDGFYDVSSVSGEAFSAEYVGRGAAYADFDNDGDLDIIIVSNLGPAILLKNNCNNRNNYFKCTLKGEISNSYAIGARLTLWGGNDIQIRQVGSQSSYLSQNSNVQHFGLGEIDKIDSLEIIWPSGRRQVLKDLSSNQHILISETVK
jgi:hypothetical protein